MSLRLSREAKSQLDDIRKACRVSSDDTGIARHFHVPLYEVQAIRLELPDHDAFERRVRPEAVASAELLERCEALFAKWEKRYGYRTGAGKLLVPAGYNPEREAEAA